MSHKPGMISINLISPRKATRIKITESIATARGECGKGTVITIGSMVLS